MDLAVEVPPFGARAHRQQRNVGRDLRPHRRTGAAASLDAGLRQHAPAGRARGAAPGRAHWAKTRLRRITAALSRKLRLAAERKLKNGEIRAAGRDGFAGAWHRHRHASTWFARSTRRVRSPSRCSALAAPVTGAARFRRAASSPLRAMILLECAATVRAIKHGRSRSSRRFPSAPLDILAQQIVAMCAAKSGTKTRCSSCMRRAYPVSRSEARGVRPHSRHAVAGHRRQARSLWRVSVSRHGEPPPARASRSHGWPPSPAAARFPTPRCSPWWRSRRNCRRHARRRLRGREQCRRHHAAGQYLVAHSPRGIEHRTRAGGRRAWRAPDVFRSGAAKLRRAPTELSQHVGDLREQLSALLPNTAPLPVPVNPTRSAKCGRSGLPTSRGLRAIGLKPKISDDSSTGLSPAPDNSKGPTSGVPDQACPLLSADGFSREPAAKPQSACAASNPAPRCRTPSPG